jgi:hypothetical protein
MNVLAWADNQGPQAAWVIPDTPDPDAPEPQAAWNTAVPLAEPAATFAAKGSQSWREWARHLVDSVSPVNGAFFFYVVPDSVPDAAAALRMVRAAETAKAAGAA